MREALVRSKNVPTVRLAGGRPAARGRGRRARRASSSPIDDAPVHAAGHGGGEPAGAGHRLRRLRQPRPAVPPRAGAQVERRGRQGALGGRSRRAPARARPRHRLPGHGRAAGGARARHGHGGARRRFRGPGRGQDGHHQRRHRHLVRRLHAAGGGRGVDRLRPAAADHGRGHRRTRGGAGLGADDDARPARAAVRRGRWTAPPTVVSASGPRDRPAWSPTAASPPTRTASCSCAGTCPAPSAPEMDGRRPCDEEVWEDVERRQPAVARGVAGGSPRGAGAAAAGTAALDTRREEERREEEEKRSRKERKRREKDERRKRRGGARGG